MPTLLVIDDEPTVLEAVKTIGERSGFDVVCCADGESGVEASRTGRPDLVMVDLRMPGVDGLQVLRAIHQADPRCQMVLMTGYASVETAVEAIKIGAMDYLSKPLDVGRVEELLAQVKADVAKRREQESQAEADAGEVYGMVGRSTAMRHLVGAIGRLAPFVRTALITGETGTGKELAARALHRAGRRREKPFVVVNCSAVVESLFESELFGHVRGAFAWAMEDRAGLFEAADGGVLLLDEVGDLPLGVQAKLLRVLELGEVYRVGSLEPRRVDVQVLAATNRDLRVEVAAGRFRSDLFYRLNIVEIRIPPLRERRDDIAPLARLFVHDCAERLGRPLVDISDDAAALLAAAPWDGNVRELRNVIERACLLADGGAAHDPRHPAVPAGRRRARRLGRAAGAAARRGAARRRRAAAAGDGRARPHPARAAARARQQEGRGAAPRRQPPRAVPPPRAPRPRGHDRPPPRRRGRRPRRPLLTAGARTRAALLYV